jgi:multimeric flavodoxin WrbA
MRKKLLIVYHSQSASCENLCRAAWKSASEQDAVSIVVKRAFDANSTDLTTADGLLLLGAENSGYLAGGMKDFLDRVFYPVQGASLKALGLVISAGNDGRNAEREMLRISRGMPLKLIAEPCIIRGEPSESGLARCAELGAILAAGMEMGIF